MALAMTVAMVGSTLPGHAWAAEEQQAPGIASVPAVQSKTVGEGSFTLTSQARFFLVTDSDPTGTELETYVQTVNAEFAAKGVPGNNVLPIVYGDAALAQSGDIIIKLDTQAVTNSEGYTLDITPEHITLTAHAPIGVLYGLRTVLQSMVANGTTLAAGTVEDYPDVAERSLYIDAGRVFYTVDLMESIIRTASWNKMNVLYLDFSNNNATRFFLDDMNVTVSGKTYDVGQCKPEDGYWTQDDMDEMMDTAAAYGVEIIPTFDSPGHIGGVYDVNPDWFYRADATDYDKTVGKITLDLTKQDAYDFGQALVAKYVDYFAAKGCTDFDIAADEAAYADGTHMNSNDKRFVQYVNDLNEYIVSKGMTARMFNDALKSVDSGVSKDIIILYWAPAAPVAKDLLAAGYDVVNFSYPYLYYAYGASDYWNAPLSKVYGWNPGVFGDKENASFGENGYAYPDSVGKVLGGNFAIWSDYGYNHNMTGADVIKGVPCEYQKSDYSVRQKIYAVAERAWNQDGATAELAAWEKTLVDAPAGLVVATGEMDKTALPQASAVTPAAADKTQLKDLIAQAEGMVAQSGKYVQTNWKQLVDALANAKAVVAKENAVQQEVDKAAEALNAAMLAQRLKADKTNLDKLVKQAMGLDLSGYTAQSVEQFRTALANAKAVLADESLSVDDQTVVDQAVAQLTAAMDGLTASDAPQATEKPENNVPDTGDSAYMMGYVVAALAAASMLLAVIVVGKRRHNG